MLKIVDELAGGFEIAQDDNGVFWVLQNNINVMPGACSFRSVERARKGVAALKLTRTVLRGVQHDDDAFASTFWNFVTLSR